MSARLPGIAKVWSACVVAVVGSRRVPKKILSFITVAPYEVVRLISGMVVALLTDNDFEYLLKIMRITNDMSLVGRDNKVIDQYLCNVRTVQV